jgi:hypothetical protein
MTTRVVEINTCVDKKNTHVFFGLRHPSFLCSKLDSRVSGGNDCWVNAQNHAACSII